MDHNRFRTFTRLLRGRPSRRYLLRGLAAAGLGWGTTRLNDAAAAKKRRPRKQSTRKALCRKNGSPCSKLRKTCKPKYCLHAPFTIVASWTAPADHDAYLFVPPQDATTGPAPYIHSKCTPANSLCAEAYPLACFDNDEAQVGDEVATIHELLPGAYEYVFGLAPSAPAGAVTVVLKDTNGRIVRQWVSPANPSTQDQAAWHVFDIDGRDGRVTAIDALIAGRTPQNVHEPDTHVCPD